MNRSFKMKSGEDVYAKISGAIAESDPANTEMSQLEWKSSFLLTMVYGARKYHGKRSRVDRIS